jgi:hypothetical protein
MGQEILYCFKCQTRLMGSDFDRGKAFRVDSQAACPDCVRSLLAHLPDPDAEIERLKRTHVPKPAGTPSSSTKLPQVSTSRIPVQPPRTLDAPPRPSRTPQLIAAAVGVLVVIVLLAVVFSGSDRRPTPMATPTPTPQPDPTPGPGPRPPPVDPVARDLEELDARLSLPLRQEKIRDVADMLAGARGKHATVDWTRAIDERVQKLEVAARRVAAPILQQVGPAAKKGDEAALKDLRSRLEALGVRALIGDYDAAVAASPVDPWTVLDLQTLKSREGATLSKQGDGSVLVSGTLSNQDTYTLSARVGLRRVRALRLEAIANGSLPAGGPGRAGHGNFALTEFKVLSGGTPLVFSGASATFEQDLYPASGAIDGRPLSGWSVYPRVGQTSTAFFHLQAPADLDSITIILEHGTAFAGHLLGCFRISAGTAELPPPPPPRPVEETPLKAPVTNEPSAATAAYRAGGPPPSGRRRPVTSRPP